MTLLGKVVRQCVATAIDLLDRMIGYEVELLSAKDALENSDVLIRWGDGESSLAIGKSTPFQAATPKLAREMRGLFRTRDPRITLCLPAFLMRRSPFQNSSDRFRRIWLLSALLMRLWARRASYGDAFMFRRESGMSGLNALSTIISEAPHIVLVSPDPGHRDAFLAMWPGRFVEHVRVPATDAYKRRDEIKQAILAIGGADLLLLSAGPAGKCLAAEICHENDRPTKIVDTGNLFEHLVDRGDII